MKQKSKSISIETSSRSSSIQNDRMFAINDDVDSSKDGSISSKTSSTSLMKHKSQLLEDNKRKSSLYNASIESESEVSFQVFGTRGISWFSNVFIQKNEDVSNIDTLYEVAGAGTAVTNLGKYQKIVMFLVVFQVVMVRAFFFGLSFYTKNPSDNDFQCN